MTDMFNKPKAFSETPEEREFELRAQIGSTWTGGRLFIGMYTFFLASLAFSYFYLRSANNGLLWRPRGVTAPTAFGWAIYGLVLLMAMLAIFGQGRLRKGGVTDWQVAGWTAVAGGIVAVMLQIWELTSVSFSAGSSGYASTFIGWCVMNIGTLLISTYWLETTLARSLRMRKESPGSAPELAATSSARMFRANVASMTYFLGFVALSSTLFFAMFYLL